MGVCTFMGMKRYDREYKGLFEDILLSDIIDKCICKGMWVEDRENSHG